MRSSARADRVAFRKGVDLSSCCRTPATHRAWTGLKPTSARRPRPTVLDRAQARLAEMGRRSTTRSGRHCDRMAPRRLPFLLATKQPAKGGRPRIHPKLCKLMPDMRSANPTWDKRRIKPSSLSWVSALATPPATNRRDKAHHRRPGARFWTTIQRTASTSRRSCT